MNHTPTPWKAGAFGVFSTDGAIEIADCAPVGHHHSFTQVGANAEYIALACNAYPTLVAACLAAARELIDIDNSRTVGSPPVSIAVIEQLALALAAAGETA